MIMMGGFQIEMKTLTCISDWLTGGEWIDLIKTTGAAESMLSASHVKRTRYGHQVTASALLILLRNVWKSDRF